MANDIIKFVISSDVKKAIAGVGRVSGATKKLTQDLARVGAEAKLVDNQLAKLGRTARTIDAEFTTRGRQGGTGPGGGGGGGGGATLIGGLTKRFLAFGASVVAMRTVLNVARQSNIIGVEALGNLQQQVLARKQLAQIEQSAAFGKRLAETSGFDVSAGLETQFRGGSAGFSQKEISDLAPRFSRFLEGEGISELFRSIKFAQANFGEAAGSLTEVANVLLSGAKKSQANLSELAGVLIASGEANAVRASLDELAAAGGVAASATLPERAFTELRALLTEVSKDRPDLALGGLANLLDVITSENTRGGALDIARAVSQFGDVRARAGISRLLQQREQFEQGLVDAADARRTSGTTKSPISRAEAVATGDPFLVAEFNRQNAQSKATNRSEQAGIDKGNQTSIAETAKGLLNAARSKGNLRGGGFAEGLRVGAAKLAIDLVTSLFDPDPQTAASVIGTIADLGGLHGEERAAFNAETTNILADQQRPGARNEQLPAEQKAAEAQKAARDFDKKTFGDDQFSPANFVTNEQRETSAGLHRTANALEKVAKELGTRQNQRLSPVEKE